ncbi:MAG: hypothetical protein OXE48_11295 [Gammaproteobacteria bacterium]|nr:hypothetical protein [Gammaproteobacteria bacterium]
MSSERRSVLLEDVSQLPPPNDHTMFSLSKNDVELPTDENPLRFAVLYRNGRTSNTWGLNVRPTGDAYIYCRDNMQGQKISLHASGMQHIAIEPSPNNSVPLNKDRFMNRWHQPDEGVASFRLVFPPWGIQLTEEQCNQFASTWARNNHWVEGHHELLTVVSFFIVQEKTKLTKKGKFPGFVLAEQPLKEGKKLSVTTEWQHERGLKDNILNSLYRSASFASTVRDFLGKPLTLCVTGAVGSPNSVYMVAFQIAYTGDG